MRYDFTKIKNILRKYSHAWILLYVFFYMPCFSYLEKRVNVHFYRIECALDKYIPFCELFIIPYLLWFIYVAITIGYFFFTNKREFYQLTLFLFSGMTIFLITCAIFPNGLNLRPMHFARDNALIDIVKYLYRIDTPTNVLPSLHVFNSLCCLLAIKNNEKLKEHHMIQWGAFILSILIILSTMFLKQHSVIDVVAGFALAYFLYEIFYATSKETAPQFRRQII